jgi:hypothetical protein
LPAASAHNQLSPDLPQQDFVLFDQPQPRQHPNRSSVSLSNQRRHSSYHDNTNNSNTNQQLVSPVVANQRVAQILQAIGQQSSSPVNANRFANQFYASSAPSSTAALNQQSRPARPPVPLFNQSTGSIPQNTAKMMNAADVDLDDFTAFEGGANTAFSSPAVATSFDFSGSASSSVSNLGTVSPHDLLISEPFMSAPNSSALTALTSPSIYNESPEFDSYDVSPNFGSTDLDTGDAWYPLFPQDSTIPEQQPALDLSPAQKSDDVDSLGLTSSDMARRKSSTSPVTGTPKHSSVSGVNARKRDKPLPPIMVEDPSDTVAMKRARNTLAARKSRERKAQRFEDLEDRIAKLEAERDHWKQIALAQTGAQSQ